MSSFLESSSLDLNSSRDLSEDYGTLIIHSKSMTREDKQKKSAYPVQAYLDFCASRAAEPTFEVIAALDSKAPVLSLSKRKVPIGDLDVQCLVEVLSSCDHIVSLDFSGNRLSQQGALFLARILAQNDHIEFLSLANNRIGFDGCKYICTALTSNPQVHIRELVLSGNSIGNRGAFALRDVLQLDTLKRLDISNNRIEDSAVLELTDVIGNCKSLISLSVAENEISDVSAEAIAEEIIMQSTSVTELDLSNNKIGPSGVIAMVQSLKRNKTLQSLNLRYNSMGDVGAQALCDVLAANQSNIRELLLGFNGISLSMAIKFTDMLRQNMTLRKFDMQGIVLDGRSVRTLSSSLRRNTRLQSLMLDLDASNDAVKELNESLKETTLQDLEIGASKDKIDQAVLGHMRATLNANRARAESLSDKSSEISMDSQSFDSSDARLSPKAGRQNTEQLQQTVAQLKDQVASEKNKAQAAAAIREQQEKEHEKRIVELQSKLDQTALEARQEKERSARLEAAVREKESQGQQLEKSASRSDLFKQQQNNSDYSSRLERLERSLLEERKRNAKLEQSLELLTAHQQVWELKSKELEQIESVMVEKDRYMNKLIADLEAKSLEAEQRSKLLEQRVLDTEERMKDQVGKPATTGRKASMKQADAGLLDISQSSDGFVSVISEELGEHDEGLLGPNQDEQLQVAQKQLDGVLHQPGRSSSEHSVESMIFLLDARLRDLQHKVDFSETAMQHFSAKVDEQNEVIDSKIIEAGQQVADLLEQRILERIEPIFNQLERGIGQLGAKRVSSPSLQEGSSPPIPPNSSAAMEQIKSEFETTLRRSLQELEERLTEKIEAVDFKHTSSIASMQKFYEEKLAKHTSILSKMTEEHMWIEEESLRLRVEQETQIKNEIARLEAQMRDDINATKQSIEQQWDAMLKKYDLAEGSDTDAALRRLLRVEQALERLHAQTATLGTSSGSPASTSPLLKSVAQSVQTAQQLQKSRRSVYNPLRQFGRKSAELSVASNSDYVSPVDILSRQAIVEPRHQFEEHTLSSIGAGNFSLLNDSQDSIDPNRLSLRPGQQPSSLLDSSTLSAQSLGKSNSNFKLGGNSLLSSASSPESVNGNKRRNIDEMSKRTLDLMQNIIANAYK